MKKVIVIGAGILGASTAYHLAKKGADVIIVDRQDRGQATDAAAGIICPWISQRRNQAWYELSKNGARFYPDLIAALKQDGETETGYARVGAISLHTEEKKLVGIVERATKRKEDAPEIGEITRLTPAETKALFPPLAAEYASVHISGAARVDGRALCDSLLRAAEKYGATRVNGNAILTFEGNQITGITVDDEKITADQVIVCAGAWANQLLQPLGIDFKVSFQRAQIIHVELPKMDTNKWPVVMPPSDQYLLAFDQHRLVAGATHENMNAFDYRMTTGGLQEVFTKALQTAPALADSTFLEARVGFRPFTPGFLPVIGPLPNWTGILVANGLGSSGLTIGPYLGSELAKLVLGVELDIELELYTLHSAL